MNATAKSSKSTATPKDLRSFGWLVGGVLLALAGLMWWRGHGIARDAVGALGGALVVWGTVWPSVLREIHAGWMRFAHGLGWFNTNLLLSLFYYVVLCPIGSAMRLFGRDPLDRKWSSEQSSYWIVKKEQRPSDHYEHQF
ncbi:MAG TPA: SxtJ family membrane protein [bacterium]|nr:SxtJ family membrane protein [bacterium]HPO07419.1 SxtJ family membrane protein [bacterium]HQP97067.1 SxtJ family membrane protein [bacterium]